MSATVFTREIIEQTIKESTSWSDVARRLSIPRHNATIRNIIKRVQMWGVCTGFSTPPPVVFMPQAVIDAFSESCSWVQVATKLGTPTVGRQLTKLKRFGHSLGLVFEHDYKNAWNAGQLIVPVDLQQWVDRHRGKHSIVKRMLFATGTKQECCELCNTSQWLGKPLPLHLDHGNGNRDDWQLENLQILCPNCHNTKTAEYAGCQVVRQTSRF